MKITNRALALLLAMLMLISTVMFTVTSCDNGEDPPVEPGENPDDDGGDDDGNKDDGKDDGNGGGDNADGEDVADVTYTVNLKTRGGMRMSGIPVYVWSMLNDEIDDIAASTTTDENGKATFDLNPTGAYTVQLGDIPDGYDAEDLYPLVGQELNIVLSSEVITDNTSLSGVVYQTGDIIKDFSVEITDGTKFNLAEALGEKKAVLINFFYTSCGPCVNEFPYMQEAYDKYKDDLAIIAISSYVSDSNEGVQSFKEQLGLGFDMAYTNDTSLAQAFGVTGYPTSVMIDRYGMISLIHVGGIDYFELFDIMFKHYTVENYEQKIFGTAYEIEERLVPDVEQPSSEDIGAVFEKEDAKLNVTYAPEADDEYSWPFIITEKDGKACLKSTNKQNNSYSIMNATISLKAGEAVAFDYFASTEKDADALYIIVDGKDIYTISGISDGWETCYGFVAKEEGTYTVSFCYIKDYNGKAGEDTVYLSNLRIVGEGDVDAPTYIFRYAASGLNIYGTYDEYVKIFMGSDGYYHVGSATGPILLADLMGYTLFSDKQTAYTMCLEKTYEKDVVKHCGYASNSYLNGKTPVTEELKNLLIKLASDNGAGNNANAWLEFCCYYDAYGTNGAQLEDPIKGLTPYSAYDVVISTSTDPDGSKYYPNSVTYNRLIMPRGLFFKFTPTKENEGTYLIRSNSDKEVEAWIFTVEDFEDRDPWLTYDNVARGNGDMTNCYMMAYLEAGVDYYINIAYHEVTDLGTIDFRIERLGGEGYFRFAAASSGVFTYIENEDGSVNKIIAGGIDVEYDSINDRWYNKADPNSILYVDFTQFTMVFTQDSILEMIEKGGFDFRRSEYDHTIVSILNAQPGDTPAERIAACDKYLREKYWGEDYDAYAVEYALEEIYAAYRGDAGAAYHGIGKSAIDKKILAAFDTYYAQGKSYNEIVELLVDELYDDWYALWSSEVPSADQLQQYIEAKATVYIEEAYRGKYHGYGEDMTDEIKKYLDDIIYNCKNHDEHCVSLNDDDDKTVCTHKDGNGDGYLDLDHICTCEGGELNGCVIVDARLAEILQMLMDKFTFSGVENSWTKLCYYYEYFGPKA